MQPALRKGRCQRVSHVCPQRPGVPGFGLQPEMLSDRCVHFGFSLALQSPSHLQMLPATLHVGLSSGHQFLFCGLALLFQSPGFSPPRPPSSPPLRSSTQGVAHSVLSGVRYMEPEETSSHSWQGKWKKQKSGLRTGQ